MPTAVAVADGVRRPDFADLPCRFGILGAALGQTAPAGTRERADGVHTAGGPGEPAPATQDGRPELAIAIPGPGGPWGVLLVIGDPARSLGVGEVETVRTCADGLGSLVGVVQRQVEIEHLRERATALRRVATDISSRRDLDGMLKNLLEHAMAQFGGDRGAVFLKEGDGPMTAATSRGLSTSYLASLHRLPPRLLASASIADGRPLFSVAYRDDPRGADMRAAVIQEGFDTLCTAPLNDGSSLIGLLAVYHDEPHVWSDADLETLAELAGQGGVAIRAATEYARMATWAAQLQSIQQLGTRLNRLTTVAEIGKAIASELHDLIDYHNVRVYRLRGDDLIAVAVQGQVGEYIDETPDQLGVKIGEGITGWVAANRVAQYLGDAAADQRSATMAAPTPGSRSPCSSHR